MAGNEYNPVRPKTHLTPDGVELRQRILAGSPLAVQGIFLEVLREYFLSEDAPFRWNTDANTAEILVEAGQNPMVEVNNPARAVFVTRQGSSPSSIMLGDRMGVVIPTGQEGFYAKMETSFQIDCISASKGECEVLGDFVHHFLIASRQILCQAYGFDHMTMATMGTVSPYLSDTQYYAVPLLFGVTHSFRWTTVRIAPLIEQVRLSTLTRTGIDPRVNSAQEAAEAPYDAAFAQTAFDSITRAVPYPPSKLPTDNKT